MKQKLIVSVLGLALMCSCSTHKVHCPEHGSDVASVANGESGLGGTSQKNKYDKNGRLKKKGNSVKMRR